MSIDPSVASGDLSFVFGGRTYTVRYYPAGWVSPDGVTHKEAFFYVGLDLGQKPAKVVLKLESGWCGLGQLDPWCGKGPKVGVAPLTPIMKAAVAFLGV
jgi:hypothetical protein